MKKSILNTTLISIIALSSYSFSTEVEEVEIPISIKGESLDEASSLLLEMTNHSKDGSSVKENILQKYMLGEITADEGEAVINGGKTIDKVEKENIKMINDIAEEEAKEIIEEAKERKFLKNKEPKNKELAEKFARGEITAREGNEIQRKIEEAKIRKEKAEIQVKEASEKAQENSYKDEGFFSKVKAWFNK